MYIFCAFRTVGEFQALAWWSGEDRLGCLHQWEEQRIHWGNLFYMFFQLLGFPMGMLPPKGAVALRISVLRMLPMWSPTDLTDSNSLKRVN